MDGNMLGYLAEAGWVVPMYKDARTWQHPKGSALKWWEPAAVDRLIMLYRALGERYDTHPRFAGITIGDGESALAVDKRPGAGYSGKAHLSQIIRAAREVKNYFPHTPVFTGFNYLEETSLRKIAEALRDIGGSGFIHPDTVPGKKFSTATDLEIEFQSYGVPTFAQIQTVALSDEMTESDIFEWATHTIGASMVSWNHYRQKRKGYVRNTVLPFLGTKSATFPTHLLSFPYSN